MTDSSDVAFIYWSGSRRRNKPELTPNTSMWSDFAKGFSDAGAHVVGINNADESVKIRMDKVAPDYIKYIIFQEIAWRHSNTWGQPVLKRPGVVEDKVCGLLTTDYWETAWSHSVEEWLNRYPAFRQFVITLHESSRPIFTKDSNVPNELLKFYKMNYDRQSKKSRSLRTCGQFERNIRSSFSVDRDEIIRHHKFKHKYDICVGGVVKHGNFYPLRKRLYTLITKSGKFSVTNPQRGFDSNGYRNYYKSIASSRLSLSTSGMLKNSIKKYLEIPALRSCIVGDLPLEFPFLKDVSCCLNNEMSDQEILIIIDDFLHDLPNTKGVAKHVLDHYSAKEVALRMIKEIKGE